MAHLLLEWDVVLGQFHGQHHAVLQVDVEVSHAVGQEESSAHNMVNLVDKAAALVAVEILAWEGQSHVPFRVGRFWGVEIGGSSIVRLEWKKASTQFFFRSFGIPFNLICIRVKNLWDICSIFCYKRDSKWATMSFIHHRIASQPPGRPKLRNGCYWIWGLCPWPTSWLKRSRRSWPH